MRFFCLSHLIFFAALQSESAGLFIDTKGHMSTVRSIVYFNNEIYTSGDDGFVRATTSSGESKILYKSEGEITKMILSDNILYLALFKNNSAQICQLDIKTGSVSHCKPTPWFNNEKIIDFQVISNNFLCLTQHRLLNSTNPIKVSGYYKRSDETTFRPLFTPLSNSGQFARVSKSDSILNIYSLINNSIKLTQITLNEIPTITNPSELNTQLTNTIAADNNSIVAIAGVQNSNIKIKLYQGIPSDSNQIQDLGESEISNTSDMKPTEIQWNPDGSKLLLCYGNDYLDTGTAFNLQVLCNVYSYNRQRMELSLIRSFKKHNDRVLNAVFKDNDTVITVGGQSQEVYEWKALPTSDNSARLLTKSIGGNIIGLQCTQNKLKIKKLNVKPPNEEFPRFEEKELNLPVTGCITPHSFPGKGKDEISINWQTGTTNKTINGKRFGELSGDTINFKGHFGDILSLGIITVNNRKYLVSGSRDQTVKFWQLNDGMNGTQKPVITLFPMDERGWVVWNESGEFDYHYSDYLNTYAKMKMKSATDIKKTLTLENLTGKKYKFNLFTDTLVNGNGSANENNFFENDKKFSKFQLAVVNEGQTVKVKIDNESESSFPVAPKYRFIYMNESSSEFYAETWGEPLSNSEYRINLLKNGENNISVVPCDNTGYCDFLGKKDFAVTLTQSSTNRSPKIFIAKKTGCSDLTNQSIQQDDLIIILDSLEDKEGCLKIKSMKKFIISQDNLTLLNMIISLKKEFKLVINLLSLKSTIENMDNGINRVYPDSDSTLLPDFVTVPIKTFSLKFISSVRNVLFLNR